MTLSKPAYSIYGGAREPSAARGPRKAGPELGVDRRFRDGPLVSAQIHARGHPSTINHQPSTINRGKARFTVLAVLTAIAGTVLRRMSMRYAAMGNRQLSEATFVMANNKYPSTTSR